MKSGVDERNTQYATRSYCVLRIPLSRHHPYGDFLGDAIARKEVRKRDR
jgi:hypothetical protein